MTGPRVTLASSEVMKAPQQISVALTTTDDVTKEILEAIFDRGIFKGISQWANAAWGTFEYDLILIS